jgi:hypothetical protein
MKSTDKPVSDERVNEIAEAFIAGNELTEVMVAELVTWVEAVKSECEADTAGETFDRLKYRLLKGFESSSPSIPLTLQRRKQHSPGVEDDEKDL